MFDLVLISADSDALGDRQSDLIFLVGSDFKMSEITYAASGIEMKCQNIPSAFLANFIDNSLAVRFRTPYFQCSLHIPA